MFNKKVTPCIFRRYYLGIHCDPSRVDFDQEERISEETVK